MRLGLSLGINALIAASGGSVPVTDPNVTAINSTSWDASYTSPPTFDPAGDPKYVVVLRSGFDSSGGSTTHTDNLIITQRVREPAPDNATLDPTRSSLSDVVYTSDSIVGVTNNATFESPKPTANWVMLANDTVGDTVTLECVAFHRDARNGKQVAAVEFRVTDGTTTVTQVVSEAVVSPVSSDKNAIIVYRAVVDISTLNDDVAITANAKVYPWFGVAASVLDSADQSDIREFSPRQFYRSTSLAAAPPIAYVSTAGNDGTGVVSTNDATAYASPYATVSGAYAGVRAAGNMDGARIRISAGTFAMTIPSNTYTQVAGNVVFERDPRVAASAAILNGLMRPRLKYVRFSDLTLSRSATITFVGEASPNDMHVQLSDVVFDVNSVNTAIASSDRVTSWFSGVEFQNMTASVVNAGSPPVAMLRGCENTSGVGTVESWLHVGCDWTGINLNAGARTQSGCILAFNKYYDIDGWFGCGTSTDVAQVALVQNVVEFTSSTSNPSLRVSADSATGDNYHIILHNNTFAGAYQAGRWNAFYDEGTTRRTSQLMSVKGNIVPAIYTKGDLFVDQVEGGADASSAVGNWQFNFGAGCAGNFTLNQSNTPIGGNEAQDYPGLSCDYGTSQTVPQDPGWVDNQSTTYNGTYTAGAGGGDYSLLESAAVRGLLPVAVLPYDLAGTARPTTLDSAGAYA